MTSVPYEGADTLTWLIQNFQMEHHWLERRTRGFTWWCGRFAQHIDYNRLASTGHPETEFQVTIRTDLMHNVSLDNSAYKLLHATMMVNPSLTALVFDEEQRSLYLVSQLRIYDGIEEWMHTLVSFASLFQIHEAERFAHEVADSITGEIAISGHPSRGVRDEMDDMGNAIPILVLSEIGKPTRWDEEEYAHLLQNYLQQPPVVVASGGGLGVVFEFPFDLHTTFLAFYSDNDHPIYGPGACIEQRAIYRPDSQVEGIKKALELNKNILAKEPTTYGLGSFSYEDGTLVYRMFLSNALYQPGYLINLYVTSVFRTQLLSQHLFGYSSKQEEEKSSFGTFLKRIFTRS